MWCGHPLPPLSAIRCSAIKGGSTPHWLPLSKNCSRGLILYPLSLSFGSCLIFWESGKKKIKPLISWNYNNHSWTHVGIHTKQSGSTQRNKFHDFIKTLIKLL